MEKPVSAMHIPLIRSVSNKHRFPPLAGGNSLCLHTLLVFESRSVVKEVLR